MPVVGVLYSIETEESCWSDRLQGSPVRPSDIKLKRKCLNEIAKEAGYAFNDLLGENENPFTEVSVIAYNHDSVPNSLYGEPHDAVAYHLESEEGEKFADEQIKLTQDQIQQTLKSIHHHFNEDSSLPNSIEEMIQGDGFIDSFAASPVLPLDFKDIGHEFSPVYRLFNLSGKLQNRRRRIKHQAALDMLKSNFEETDLELFIIGFLVKYEKEFTTLNSG